MSQQDLANFLRKRAEALGMSVTAVAEESGIARQTYHRLLNQETNKAKLKTLARIFKTLKTPLEQGLDYYYLSAKPKRRPSFLRREHMNHPLKTQDLRSFLEQCLTKKGLNISTLAEKAGLARQTVHTLLKANSTENCKLDTLSAIARALNISVYDLIQPIDNNIYISTASYTKPTHVSRPYDTDTYKP